MSTIYVIHKNGDLFSTRGKVGYLTEADAKGVISHNAEQDAILVKQGWHSTSKYEQKARIEAARTAYEVVAYGPIVKIADVPMTFPKIDDDEEEVVNNYARSLHEDFEKSKEDSK